jgi:small subunit ribosomal protein S4
LRKSDPRMGDPKKARKKYSTPKHPWRGDQLSQELYLVGTYGLRTKRELWGAQTELSRIRKQARMLLAEPQEIRAEQEARLLKYLSRIGVVDPNAALDDVLGLTIESILERRLQTVTWRKGLAKSPHQARQMIAHGHVSVGGKVLSVPNYTVSREEEGSVRIRDGSPLLKAYSAQPTPV